MSQDSGWKTIPQQEPLIDPIAEYCGPPDITLPSTHAGCWMFRLHSGAPVLSLLLPLQQKLPEATFSVESMDPQSLIHTIREILPIN